MAGELATSEITGAWGPPVRQLCNPSPPELCDCGYEDHWEHRWVHVWHVDLKYIAGDVAKRRWLREGFPVRDGGWWVIGGWDERCPGCGDIERFDMDANCVRRWSEQAKVVIFMDAHRPITDE